MNEEKNNQGQEPEKPQNDWTKYFPQLTEEDYRKDAKAKLFWLRQRGRIPGSWDREQLEDFIVWLAQFKNETPIRYAAMSPHAFFPKLLSNLPGNMI